MGTFQVTLSVQVCVSGKFGQTNHTTSLPQDLVAEKCSEYFERFRRQTFVTPKSYLSFIDSYKIIYGEKIAHVGTLAERMKTGRTGTGCCPDGRRVELQRLSLFNPFIDYRF